jgi:diguanylate cyclase (GGDEF)-like protein
MTLAKQSNGAASRTRRFSPTRITLVIAIVLVTAILSVAIREIVSSRDDTYANSRREMEMVNLALANQTEQLFLTLELALNSTRAELQHISTEKRSDPSFVQRLLAAHVAAVPAVTNMGFIDAKGLLVAHSSVTSPGNRRLEDRSYFQTLRDQSQDQLIIEEPFVGRVSNKRLIFVARRVTDANGAFLGVVVASVDTQWIIDMLRSLVTFEGGTSAVFRSDARLLARFPDVENAYGRSFSNIRLFREQIPGSPSGIFKDTSTIDGKDRFISYRTLERYPLVVNVSIEERILLGHWRRSALRIGGSALIGSLLVLALFLVIHHQLQQLEAQARALRKQAHTDTLTGLPNRLLFEDRLERALAAASRKERQLAVLFIDLDKFKEVNDTLGHAAGDLLLQETARRLSTCLREMDTVSRLGGDEFTILLPEMENATDADAVAQKIVETIAHPFDINGRAVTVTCSVGIALYPNGADDAGTLVRHADFAMYTAKQAGHNCFRRYQASA